MEYSYNKIFRNVAQRLLSDWNRIGIKYQPGLIRFCRKLLRSFTSTRAESVNTQFTGFFLCPQTAFVHCLSIMPPNDLSGRLFASDRLWYRYQLCPSVGVGAFGLRCCETENFGYRIACFGVGVLESVQIYICRCRNGWMA